MKETFTINELNMEEKSIIANFLRQKSSVVGTKQRYVKNKYGTEILKTMNLYDIDKSIELLKTKFTTGRPRNSEKVYKKALRLLQNLKRKG